MTSPSNASSPAALSGKLTALFGFACGATVANLYYAQPLTASIASSLHLAPSLAGLVVALTQLGYGAGLLLLVPLADELENRRLSLFLLAGVILGLLGVGSAPSAALFMAATFLVGVCASVTQILVPFASHLTSPQTRGRVVGNVMGGLLAGIMLARPIASAIADTAGWRPVFYVTAALMVCLGALLAWRLPPRHPGASRKSYAQIVGSLPRLFLDTPLLRRRALYQGMMFAAFNVFWTASPLLLTQAFGMSQKGIALFALAGAGGALSAPLAGRLADRGYTRPATGGALVSVVLAFALAAAALHLHSITLLLIAALLLDAAVQVCQVLNLRSLYMLAPEQRGRLNGLFMASVFVCGAVGSSLAAAVFYHGGWNQACLVGALMVCAAIAFYTTEFRASHPKG